ncbi:ATP-binding cassette domain-containing protein [Paeniroseomonas aquatica]
MLAVEDLSAGYGGSQVLAGVSLSVGPGEVVTLLGRNGMGKTTTIRALMGLLPGLGGRVLGGRADFAGTALLGRAPHRIARLGLGLVPEGRQVFPTLSVEENLTATAASRFGAPRWGLREVFGLFPRLEERRRQPGPSFRAASSRCWRSAGR